MFIKSWKINWLPLQPPGDPQAVSVWRDGYFHFARWLLFCYLAAMLALGRAFAIQHIDLAGRPIFVTEWVLFFSLPVLFFYRKRFRNIPGLFRWACGFFFAWGFSYLVRGVVFDRNLFALRDVVLCGYMLFVPLIYLAVRHPRDLRWLLGLMVAGDTVALLTGRIIVFGNAWSESILNFFLNGRSFNAALCYGIAVAVILSGLVLGEGRMSRAARWGWGALLALNVYMILIIGARTAWLALAVMLVMFVVILRSRLIKCVTGLLPVMMLVFVSMFWFDFVVNPDPPRQALAKLKSLSLFARTYEKLEGSRSQADISFGEAPSTGPSTGKPFGRSERPAFTMAAAVTVPPKAAKRSREKSFHLLLPEVSEESLSELTTALAMVDQDRANPDEQETYEALHNIYWRFNIWHQTWEFGLQKKWLGQGFGVYPQYQIWATEGRTGNYIRSPFVNSGVLPAHNHFLTLFFKMGIGAAVWFFFLNALVLYYAWRYWPKEPEATARRWLILGATGGLIYWHVMALFFDVIDSPPTNIFLWILWGLILVGVFGSNMIFEERSAT